jgi:uncharacterized repeat protein (TIGR02543 family)
MDTHRHTSPFPLAQVSSHQRQIFWLWLFLFFPFVICLGQNPVAVENALTGNPASEWDVSGAGDPSIQGFATSMSINTGGTIDFKIDVQATTNYSIKIYRLGYYGGDGARLIADLGNAFVGTQQPAPLYDAVTGKTDCSNWSVSASWTASNAVSGVYLAKLSRNDNPSLSSHITFIVRDDAGNADILFKTADATWQAYNAYGGNSLYVNNSGTPVPGFNHATKVSYNRPFITRDGGGGGGAAEDWLFNAEYPMIRWLERNGYDVSYTTDVDMDQVTTPITPLIHKILLSVGHDEYWSASERAAFETARNNGVHLAFFSGNEVYWKTRWEDNNRTLVCYKEGTLGENVCQTDCDPDPNIWTGLWRTGCDFTDNTDGCEPENALTGQISWALGTGSIEVPDTYKDLRFWRNTSIAALTTGQTVVLPDGTLGYEFDFEQYFDSYPGGRVTLSNTNLVGQNHKLSLYRHSSGALVFGAGTVQWSWGLDEVHDRGNNPASLDMQQATINLLADMGVQPATIETGSLAIASNDLIAPVTTISTPVNAATLSQNTPVSIAGTAVEAVGVVAGVEVSTDGGTTWQLASGTTNWTYTWTPTAQGAYVIQARAFDDLGNLEVPASGQANYVDVTVGPPGTFNCPCSIWDPLTTVPLTPNEQDATANELGVKFRSAVAGYITGLRFYKGNQNTGTHTGNLWTTTGQNLGTVIFTGESASGWQEATFSAPIAINANTTYVASYHTTSGYYSEDENYFSTGPGAAGIVNGPLLAIPNSDADGPNSVYTNSATSAFPNLTFLASNYYVDVVFETSTGPDLIPPTVLSNSPANNATGVSIGLLPSVIFSEGMDPASLSNATLSMTSGGTPVLGTVNYFSASKTATFTPSAALNYNTTYTLTVTGGPGGVTDLAGNELATNYTWTYTTSSPPPPPPTDGPGGPILVISSTSNDFSRYPVEILRSQGFNAFAAEDISQVDLTMMNNYDVILLGEFPLAASFVTDLTTWVNAGGTLIAFRPDAQLNTLMGISPVAGSLAEGYLLVNTASGPGAGIVGQTIQYHGEADYYTLNGASSLATLYSDATTSTPYVAVSQNNVGASGGKAIAFAYDLAKSIVYTRQGNPVWEGQNRDVNATPSDGVIRPNDLFYGDAPGDPQTDWIDLDKAQIPQADEQMHLLANIILLANLHRKPLPRFWMLPNNFKAAVVMTGDDHAVGLTSQFFDQFIALSPSNTPQAVTDWQAIRGSSYMYTNTPLPNALNYQSQGFEVGLHVNTGCAVWTPASLASDYTNQLGQFGVSFPGILPPSTHRTHCIAWSDYDTQPQVMAANGMRLDVNYYYWPESWVLDRPGMFTGSGMPMRFATKDGALIDCYQVPTQLTDESGQTISLHITTLLDNAVGPNGYYGVFCANMHTDRQTSITLATDIINAAITRGVPVVSSRQMLEWLDGRNGSSFDNLTWVGNDLSFDVTAGNGAHNLYGMIPLASQNGQLLSLNRGGSAVSYTIEVIKGINYALFPATTGSGTFVANYGIDQTAPLISNIQVATDGSGNATITWDTDEPATSIVDYGSSGSALSFNTTETALVTSHSLVLSGLTLGVSYDYRVSAADLASNLAESPVSPGVLSFTMPNPPSPPCGEDITAVDFGQGSPDANTLVIEEGDGGVALKPTLIDEFTATSLDATSWTQGIWNPGGSVSLPGGSIILDGANIHSNSTFGPGTAMEFEATFTGGNFQTIGFAADDQYNPPWVSVGIGNNAGAIYLRDDNGAELTVLPASEFGVPHVFRIHWNTNSIEVFVDNATTAAATLAVTVATNMVAIISDFPTGTPNLEVNWVRVSPFASSGSYTSRILDQGSVDPWGVVNWNGREPAGTSLDLFARTGNTATPDGTWTPYVQLANGVSLGTTGQYLQYRADLATTDSRFSPVLQDITFECGAAPDVTPPVIGNITATSAADGLSATISWTTDEAADSRVDYDLSASPLNQQVTDNAYVLAHSLVLTGLTPGTTYYYRITSSDIATNATTEPDLGSAALSFTTATPPCFADLVASDFDQGTTSGTQVTSDGVLLLPTAGSAFNTLPPVTEWASFPWTGGTSTVAGGILSVDGARYNSQPATTTFGPGSVLECVATFGASDFQHIGFGGGTDAIGTGGIYNGDDPWAMFSTYNTTNAVYARVYDGATFYDYTIPQNLIGTAHNYRIEWRATEVEFFVDGTSVHLESATIPGTMRPAISDFNSGGPAVAVDWMEVRPYLSPGSFESRVFDAGVAKDWEAFTWTADLPAGTSLAMSVRTGSVLPLTGAYTPIASSGDLVNSTDQYIQYRADLATSDGSVSPLLQSVSLFCADPVSAGPIITLDPLSEVVCEGETLTFTSAASGNPTPTVQWQKSTDGGLNFNDIIGATTSVLSFAATATDDGSQYQAVWSDGTNTATSASASLTVNPLATGTLVASSSTVCSGETPELIFTADPGTTGPYTLDINGQSYAGIQSGVPFSVVDPALSPRQIWTLNPSPTYIDDVDAAVVGVKFQASSSGYISAIRFFKSWTDGGVETFTARLWTNGTQANPGTLLAEADITLDDTQSGWQEVSLTNPVFIQANTTYIASYYSPNARYSATTGYFSTTDYNEPGSPLTAIASGGPAGPNGVYVYSVPNAQSTAFPFPSYTFNDANYWVDVAFDEFQASPQVLSYTLNSIEDADNCVNTSSPLGNASVTVNPRPNGTLQAADITCPGNNHELTFNALAGTGPFSLVINGTTYNNISSGTPFDSGIPAASSTATIWDPSTTGGSQTVDNAPTELGVSFTSSVAGSISAIRFYKTDNNVLTGSTVSLWQPGNPTPLITVNYTGDNLAGWKQVDFPSPVSISANTTYRASYFSPNLNYYAFTAGGLVSPVSNGPLTAQASFFQQPGPGYPDVPSTANYWIDVVLETSGDELFSLTSITDANGCLFEGTPIGEATGTFTPNVLAIDVPGTASACDDSGTPADPIDDTFTVSVTVSASNGGPSNAYFITDGTNSWGPFGYGTVGTTGAFAADGSTLTGLLSAYDADDQACGIDVGTFGPVNSCSNLPLAPVLLGPADASTGISISPVLSWNAVASATAYQLQVSTTSDFSSTVLVQTTSLTSFAIVPDLLPNTLYYWRVNATNAAGNSSWSTEWSFTTIGSYTVSYDGNGNDGGAAPVDGNSPYLENSTVTVLDQGTLSQTGYSFAGWNTAADGSGTSYGVGATFSITGNITLFAQWTINSYTVSYDGNGNDGGVAPVDGNSPYIYNSTVTVLDQGTLTQTGYSFAGWNTAADGSGTSYGVGATFSITGNTTLFAQWTINSYTVSYDGNGNDGGVAPVDGNSPYLYNSTVTVLDQGTLTQTGYSFAGWNTAADGSGTSYGVGATFSITGNTTLYAQWTINSYTVSYDGNGNDGGVAPVDGNSPYPYNSTVTVLAQGTLSQTGYSFAGWNTVADGSGTSYGVGATFSITGNITLFAQWTINSYTVSYDGNGNDGGVAPVDGNSPYPYNSTVTVLDQGTLTQTGYSFAGWNTAADGSGTSYAVGATFSITENTTLFAQWTINSYTVSYDGNGNDGGVAPVDGNSPYLYNSTVTVLDQGTLTQTGYSFAGWNTAADGSGISYAVGATFSITENTTLYAQWTINSYTVSYDGNGNDGGVAPVDGNSPYIYNSTVTVLDQGTLTQTGYSFAGWNTAADGSGTSYAVGATFSITENTTLYAQWTIITSLAGSLSLQGRTNFSSAVSVDLYVSGQSSPIQSFSISTDASGNFNISGLTPGTYEVAVKADYYLQSVETLIILPGANSGSFGQQLAGDADGDNMVGLLDFSLLASAYGTQSSDPLFNIATDFNGDGSVGLLDFSLLAANFNKDGDEPGN